jgi:hypothetical protein
MFDARRIRGFMENTFPDAPASAVGGPLPAGSRYVAAHASGRVQRGAGVRGSVAVLFALAAMSVGVAASRLLLPARAPSRPAAATPAPAPVAPPVAPMVAPPPRISLSRPPSLPALPTPTPLPVRPAERVAAVAPPARIAAVAPPVGDGRGPTPHLTGVALQRALAQDVIDTRLLNEAALRGQAAAAGRTASRRD